MKTNFFYNDQFYDSIEEMMIDLEIDEENIEDQPDFITVYKAQLEPMVTLSADWIMERIDEERFSENGNEGEKLEKILKQIDFKNINEQIPKLWYETGVKMEITKADLYEALK